ncbi:conserved hypothetical protein [Gammaproteobacteria bacterium]
MEKRTLTITINSDWQGALRMAARRAFSSEVYQGETLNFETPAAFFGQLTERRWAILHTLNRMGEIPARDLARWMGRDLKQIQEDAAILVSLGLIERMPEGTLRCPFEDIHVDMHLRRAA